MASYRAMVGMNYIGPDGADVRVEPGDVREDFPEQSLPWLIEGGYVVAAPAPEPAAVATPPDLRMPAPQSVEVAVPPDEVAAVEALLAEHQPKSAPAEQGG